MYRAPTDRETTRDSVARIGWNACANIGKLGVRLEQK
jgi:hypothetical protein